MMPDQRKTPAGGPGSGMSLGERRFHVHSATAEPLLQRLEGVQKSGAGWRARCPSCGGASGKLSIAESEGKVLLHCFGGCRALEVLEAVGLGWSDIMPPRHWPPSREERQSWARVLRETALAGAIDVLAVEVGVVAFAARSVAAWQPLSVEDDQRLALAVERIGSAAVVLTRKEAFRPEHMLPPSRLVTIKLGAVEELRRELATAERELESAKAVLEALAHREAA